MNIRRLLQMACILLTGMIILPWLRDPGAGEATPLNPGMNSESPRDFNFPGPIETYRDILDRPVFVAARRMPADAASFPHQPNEVVLLDRYPVVGVVVAGDQRLVLIRKSAGDTVSRIEQGAELDGWTLTEVSRARLVLEKAGQRKEISLHNKGGSAD
ncbi:MAG: hypothetical protein EXR08_01670 [Alphaproteobacteria bacterium]|nr:hypothetical protein [Alphaproteobacteria bacterium]